MSEIEPDRNSMAYWFPLIQRTKLPVPKTALVEAPDLSPLLDGNLPEGWDEFSKRMERAIVGIQQLSGSQAVFLRTGHTSGKHRWGETCFLPELEAWAQHVFRLVEESHLASIFVGLPTDVWAVRALVWTAPLFRCREWEGCPVNREVRVFVRDKEQMERQAVGGGQIATKDFDIEMFPYWPEEAVEEGDPDRPDWRERLQAAAMWRNDREPGLLARMASLAQVAVGGGYWSVDFLYDAKGSWWLTDMALGEDSYKPGG